MDFGVRQAEWKFCLCLLVLLYNLKQATWAPCAQIPSDEDKNSTYFVGFGKD